MLTAILAVLLVGSVALNVAQYQEILNLRAKMYDNMEWVDPVEVVRYEKRDWE